MHSFVPTPDVLVSPCGNSAPATCDASPRAVCDFSHGFQIAPPVPEAPFRETAIDWAQFAALRPRKRRPPRLAPGQSYPDSERGCDYNYVRPASHLQDLPADFGNQACAFA